MPGFHDRYGGLELLHLRFEPRVLPYLTAERNVGQIDAAARFSRAGRQVLGQRSTPRLETLESIGQALLHLGAGDGFRSLLRGEDLAIEKSDRLSIAIRLAAVEEWPRPRTVESQPSDLSSTL